MTSLTHKMVASMSALSKNLRLNNFLISQPIFKIFDQTAQLNRLFIF